jgi:putative ABC transport system permease protein
MNECLNQDLQDGMISRIKKIKIKITSMANYFFKSVFRGFRKQKMITLINLLGLSIGLALVMFISTYLINETQTDKFHKNSKFIYRVEMENQSTVYPITADPLSGWLKENFAEIELSARIFSPFFKTLQYVTVDNHSFDVSSPLFVDSSFFKIFSFPVALGKNSEQLNDKYSVVLTAPLAKKLFGEENPVGKTLSYCGKNLYTVTAVMKELPSNSSIQFDILLPFAVASDYSRFDLNNWGNSAYHTIVQTKSPPAFLSEKINTAIKKQFPNNDFRYFLTSLNDIHFSSGSTYDFFKHGSKAELYLFLIVAISVLFIAIINFVNLSVALSSFKIRETGIQKIAGAGQTIVLFRFITESVLISLLSAFIAMAFIELLFPLFNSFLQYPVSRSLIRSLWFYFDLFGLGLVTGLVAGIYPALKFSHVPVATVLKDRQYSSSRDEKWGKSLLVFQFATSIALIISALFLNRQMDYIQNQELGFDKEHVLYIPLTEEMIGKKDVITEQLCKLPGIINVSSSDFIPGQTYSRWRLTVNANGENKEYDIFHTQVKAGYVQTLGLKIVQGRDFDPARQTDKLNYLVNESFVKEHMLTNPLEATLNGAKIIGVIKNFNFCSLHQQVEPLAIRLADKNASVLLIRMSASNMSVVAQLMAAVKSCIIQNVANTYTDIKFMDQHIQNQYQREAKTAQLLNCFTFFAIFISCLGLFALAVLTINSRTKEIGIRKVNGARVSEVMAMLNRDFVKWVAIAFVIATPIAYYAMNKWLESFAYKTSLSWWIFALAGLLALGIALLTVSWQSWKAATRNPVEALRYE